MENKKPLATDKYRYCNHHHELTPKHCAVDFGDGPFIANIEAVPLLKALNEIGLRTRTHHVDENAGFVSILIDANVDVSIRQVNEIHADRDKYNGVTELLIRWDR